MFNNTLPNFKVGLIFSLLGSFFYFVGFYISLASAEIVNIFDTDKSCNSVFHTTSCQAFFTFHCLWYPNTARISIFPYFLFYFISLFLGKWQWPHPGLSEFCRRLMVSLESLMKLVRL